MKIAIDISPIDVKSTSQHKVRGVGKYISLLVENLEKFDKTNKYIFTSHPKKYLHEVDLIHYPYFDPFFLTLPFMNKTKTIVTVHDVVPLIHKEHFPVGFKGALKWRINKARLKKVSGIITDSNASKKDIVYVTGIKSEKIHVVYLCVDEEFRRIESKNEDIRRKLNIPEKFLLYVGDVTWNKNLPRLVNAVKKSNIPLVMVGKALTEDYNSDHPWNFDRNIVLKKIENDPLFIRLGFVATDDLVLLYNSAQALVMPSLDEGFGLPVLEAMKSGCPVITSKMGSLPEVGDDAVYYVDATNENDIANGITTVVGNESLRRELIEKGLIQSTKFSIKRMIEETVASYSK